VTGAVSFRSTVSAICCACLLLVAACSSSRPSKGATAIALPPLQIGLSYGDTLTTLSSEQLGAQLDDAVTLGARWVRTDLEWAQVQPASATEFDWSAFDAVEVAARDRGLSLLPIIDTTPPWARPKGCTTSWCAPADPSQFAAFANSAVRRYAPQGVHTWEIWNEPNVEATWQPAPRASAYVTLLRQTVPAMRNADARLYLISGSLASNAGRQGVSQLTFLKQFCALGGNRLVDAVGYHPYSFPVLATNPVEWNAWSKIASTRPSFRSILTASGTPDLPVWLTEYGAPTNGPGALATNDNVNVAEHPDHVSEAYQADMATVSIKAAIGTPGVGALFWYSDRDLGDNPDTTENFYGLRRAGGSVKPAFAALQAAIAAR
jgi:hypothetical protein